MKHTIGLMLSGLAATILFCACTASPESVAVKISQDESEELSIFIPFNVQEINDNQGYCYGFNKVSKNLIIGNRKLLKNGNGMVFGVPGSGKSYNEKSEMG